jgi:ferredoxin-NADP reductase
VSDPATTDTMQGLIELEKVEVLPDSQAYLCGPLPFMDLVRSDSWRGGFPKPTSTTRSSGRTSGSPASDS